MDRWHKLIILVFIDVVGALGRKYFDKKKNESRCDKSWKDVIVWQNKTKQMEIYL